MFEWVTEPAGWASLITLTVMEIVLGIDNIIFVSLIVGRLEGASADRARGIGLMLAFVFRVVLLSLLAWIITLQRPLFDLFDVAFSWRDLILLAGGLFLIVKATREIHDTIEQGEDDEEGARQARPAASFMSIIVQIAIIDMVFSIDSIITAIGMAEHLSIMIAAVVVALVIMYVASGPIAGFIRRHPTTKMLALAFLLLIGVALVADGLSFHIPRGYIYFSMAFAAAVEVFNVMAAKRRRERREAVR
ncbi:putative tellurium resistance membrane protein TerC [Breoghania corrubedonensis]|uniref:Putative tellurium resistance membrane protein TerC n=1 Tax=Breoghania corrubedonensis TaxID=665038 RepID=A0A2T5V8P9_9HYPH|nr:TerC family protein [Breoghania corrubedonensis]PTW60127.1 putative tellurium resistance membrane protein TerC [Breoghania corrubedonensis]